MKLTPRTIAGFTIIEFVVALVVIGIVAAVTISRMVRGSAMSGIVVRDQVIAMTRKAQQNALGREDVNLEIKPDGGTLIITASDTNGEITKAELSLKDLVLTGDINQTDSCPTTPPVTAITNSNPMTLNFDSLGDLDVSGITGSTAAIDTAVRVCINNDPLLSVCISPSGFAYAGDCDD